MKRFEPDYVRSGQSTGRSRGGPALALFAAVACLTALVGCRQSGEGMEVFVALPKCGEGWVWQTFQLRTGNQPSSQDPVDLSAEFALISYGQTRTVEAVLAYCRPDHSGLDDPLATDMTTFSSDLLDSEWVGFEFEDVVLDPAADKPLAVYLFVLGRGKSTCDVIVRRTGDLEEGCLYLQHRSDLRPTAIGRARFRVE